MPVASRVSVAFGVAVLSVFSGMFMIPAVISYIFDDSDVHDILDICNIRDVDLMS